MSKGFFDLFEWTVTSLFSFHIHVIAKFISIFPILPWVRPKILAKWFSQNVAASLLLTQFFLATTFLVFRFSHPIKYNDVKLRLKRSKSFSETKTGNENRNWKKKKKISFSVDPTVVLFRKRASKESTLNSGGRFLTVKGASKRGWTAVRSFGRHRRAAREPIQTCLPQKEGFCQRFTL